MPKQIPITLNVAHVGERGNAANGKYFYSCDPNVVSVTEKDTPINISLAADSAKRFDIVNIFFTDSGGQISLPAIATNSKSIVVTHANSKQMLVVFSITVVDTTTGLKVNCDPQATNIPPE